MKTTARLVVCAAALACLGCGGAAERRDTVRIGSKNFTEQLVLGHLMVQLVEARTDLQVTTRFNLGGTMICHQALLADEIDLYPEYTGTALTAVLQRPVVADPDSAYRLVSRAYAEQFESTWLPPFGFNNTYAITVRAADARRRGWERISDLAPVAAALTAGFTAEFVERPDGYRGLRDAYGFDFGQVRDLEPGLMYRAVQREDVDLICAFATDGRIPAYELQPLVDDLGFFPPYYAAPVVRNAALARLPALRRALQPLFGALSDSAMQRLNYEVDELQREPRQVARAFLAARKLIPDPRR